MFGNFGFGDTFGGFGRGSGASSGGPPALIPATLTSIEANGEFAVWDGTPPADLSLYGIAVDRQGYDSTGTATTWTQVIQPTIRKRQAWPNNASPTASSVALSHGIYAGDTANGVGGSTMVSPKPIFEWTCYDRTLVGNSVTVKATAYHISGIAAVKFTATDTNGGSVSVTVSTQTLRICLRSGFAVGEYVGVIDISTLSQTLGTTPGYIEVNATAYPKSGALPFTTPSPTITYATPRGLVFRKHVAAAAAPVHAYWQDGASGGTASVTEATARAAPFPTMDTAIVAAISLNNSLYGLNLVDGIRLHPTGTATLTGSTVNRNTGIAGIIIEQDTDISGRYVFGNRTNLNCRVTGSAPVVVAGNTFIMRRVSITRSGTSSFFSNTTGSVSVYLDDCDVNAGGGVAGNIGAGSPAIWVKTFDCHFTGVATSSAWFNAGSNPVTAFVGCTSDNLNVTSVPAFNVQGTNFTNCRIINSAGLAGQFILTSSRIGTFLGGAQSAIGRSSGMTLGTIIANVEYEECTGEEANRWAFLADGQTSNSDHVLCWHVVSAGFQDNARFNACYNDVAGTNRRHTNWSFIGCIWKGRIPWKSDTFIQDGGNYDGNWGFGMGVNCRGNFVGFNSNAVQMPEYFGKKSVLRAAGAGVLDPLFVNDQSSTSTSGPPGVTTAGGGDYALQGGSQAAGIVDDTLMPWTITGAVRATSGANAGAR